MPILDVDASKLACVLKVFERCVLVIESVKTGSVHGTFSVKGT